MLEREELDAGARDVDSRSGGRKERGVSGASGRVDMGEEGCSGEAHGQLCFLLG